MAFELSDDYIDVAARIQEFRAKHIGGTLAPLNPAEPFKIVDLNGKLFVVVVAAAYRSTDDPRPGVGMAWEPFPGTTPYTRNSELQNAETAAWGRAIIAVGAADSKRGVASAEEVRNRQAEQYEPGGPAGQGSDWRPPANPSTRKADRHNAGRKGPLPDDQWTAVSGQTGEVNPPAESLPGTSTPDQHRDIAIRLDAKGLTGREAKLLFCGQTAKRKIGSSKDLSYTEAFDVLRAADKLPAPAAP